MKSCSQSDTGSVVNVTTLSPGSVIDVDRWTANDCRDYLRYTGREYDARVSPMCAALITRVRARLASLQLAELYPVDPRD